MKKAQVLNLLSQDIEIKAIAEQAGCSLTYVYALRGPTRNPIHGDFFDRINDRIGGCLPDIPFRLVHRHYMPTLRYGTAWTQFNKWKASRGYKR